MARIASRSWMWLLALASASCFGSAASRGGGQIGEQAARKAAAAAASPYDIAVPDGYTVELVADRLTMPTGVAFGPAGEIYVVESGYSVGEVTAEPRLLAITPGDVPRTLATGDHGPWTGVAADDRALYVAQGGQEVGGRIVRYDLQGGPRGGLGEPQVLVENLPSLGDHQTNGPIVQGNWVYFGQGTATNSGVVGTDSADFGWLGKHPSFHDTPCQDIALTGITFESPNPLTTDEDKATTSAYSPFGQTVEAGTTIHGKVPCNGAIMRVPIRGGDVELVAWGFRNPYGLAFDPDGKLFATDNGYDVRGSRPVFGAADNLWRVEHGRWYGWPDFAEGRPLTADAYAEADGAPKGFVLARQPGQPPQPTAQLPVHSSADGFDFSRSEGFGHVGEAFIALFGDMAPAVGKVIAPVGFSVVRVNVRTGHVEDFARNRGDASGPASKRNLRGLERPIAARFDPSGDSLYVVDFGVLRMTDQGPEPLAGSGALWRITRSAR
jgi:glucose/arabinose dehydrogenase